MPLITTRTEYFDVSVNDQRVVRASGNHADFSKLGLSAPIVKALGRAKITTPTPVQAAVLPDAIAGRDVLGRAATGSGKTLAFGLPILTRLAGSKSKPKSPRALIIVPTRELAGQVRASMESLADAVGLKLATVYGGTPYDRQIKRLRAGADIVVATPGRLKDLVDRDACRLDRVEMLVLDEADHLCDLGFFPIVSELVSATPAGGQRMLLSATLDGDVDRLVRAHLSNPVTHDCVPDDSDRPDMEHHVLMTAPSTKLESAAELLRANPRSIVFTRTRHGATNLAADLAKLGVTTVDLHGSLSQNARERNLRKFKTGQADVVVATDVAARGIHVDGVSLVVHYDVPTEHKAYLHRSGRTARAGSSGIVVTMTTPRHVGSVVRLQKSAGVTARHHDARTAPRPMTPEALAVSGTESAPASSDHYDGNRAPRTRTAAPRRSGGGSSYSRRRPESAESPRRPAAKRDDYRHESRSESRQGERRFDDRPKRRTQTRDDRRPTTSRREPVAAEVSADNADNRTTAPQQQRRNPRKPGAGSGQKKARWTGAQKRAAAKR